MLDRFSGREHFGLFLNGNEWQAGGGAWRHHVDGRLEIYDERGDFREPIESATAGAGRVTFDQILNFADDVD